ncbi:20 kDa chaperonin, chloroplastic-like [Quercus robur]|uniref:20 kDa chaperonin, chloroplastic-like n=1 Tax=Quercus robur TaxID=38942 RepID=UPI002162391E|nr:20 kDa chaperonin, chloroplastic-like [Quercus robur]XP_050260354.1 20 kDa chaperonin, chloroplastic-like [Quercus robur]
MKDDDIVGILETDDAKELKPLNDRVLIKVIAVGPGPLDEEGYKKPLSLAPGSIVMYSNYSGIDFKGKDGYDYIALRVSDVMAVLVVK